MAHAVDLERYPEHVRISAYGIRLRLLYTPLKLLKHLGTHRLRTPPIDMYQNFTIKAIQRGHKTRYIFKGRGAEHVSCSPAWRVDRLRMEARPQITLAVQVCA